MDEVKQKLKDLVAECSRNEIRDWTSIKNMIKDELKGYIFQKTKRNPMILPIIMEV
jgi:ribonuclease J